MKTLDLARLRLLCLAIILPSACAVAQPPPDSTQTIDQLAAWAERSGDAVPAWGESWDPARDPGGVSKYLYAVLPDSSVWIRLPSGQAVQMDPIVTKNIGELAAERTGLVEAQENFLGYGIESGRLYLYARQGVSSVALAITIALALVGTVGAIIFLGYRLRSEKAQRVQLVDARQRLNASREEERTFLARELHDGPIQDLHVLHLRLGVMSEGGGEAQVREVAEPLISAVSRTINDLRSITTDLRPPAIGPFGLAGALRSLASRLATTNPSVQVDLKLDEDGQALPDVLRSALYRVAQEATTNAIKHGPPETITVELRIHNGRATLTVTDDGPGFDTATPPANGHYGMIGMSEQAAAVGATFRAESTPGGPTRILTTSPIPAAP